MTSIISSITLLFDTQRLTRMRARAGKKDAATQRSVRCDNKCCSTKNPSSLKSEKFEANSKIKLEEADSSCNCSGRNIAAMPVRWLKSITEVDSQTSPKQTVKTLGLSGVGHRVAAHFILCKISNHVLNTNPLNKKWGKENRHFKTNGAMQRSARRWTICRLIARREADGKV